MWDKCRDLAREITLTKTSRSTLHPLPRSWTLFLLAWLFFLLWQCGKSGHLIKMNSLSHPPSSIHHIFWLGWETPMHVAKVQSSGGVGNSSHLLVFVYVESRDNFLLINLTRKKFTDNKPVVALGLMCLKVLSIQIKGYWLWCRWLL